MDIQDDSAPFVRGDVVLIDEQHKHYFSRRDQDTRYIISEIVADPATHKINTAVRSTQWVQIEKEECGGVIQTLQGVSTIPAFFFYKVQDKA